MYYYRCKLGRVIDGDTIVVSVDLGMKTWRHDEHIRLNGINAPEMNTVEGRASRAALIDMLASHPLELQTHKADEEDKYGRYLGTLWTVLSSGTRENVNLAMIDAGHAVAKEYR